MSPWSRFYKEFVDAKDMYDMTRGFPVLFSWRLAWFPLFWSHIDYVFSSDSDVI